MRAVILKFPGINREADAARALEQVSGVKPEFVWHGEHDLPRGTDIVLVPGGFSYGDYLRCGAIAARANIMNAVRRHAANGGYVLGICNGFQILCESGLLPGVLVRNRDLQFVCRMQHLKVERTDTRFTNRYSPGEIIKVCIAHGEGNYLTDPETLKAIEDDGRVAFRYCNVSGEINEAANPNGSLNNIAGIFSEKLNVLGMMPHPENLIDPLTGGTDGRGLFESLMQPMVRAA